MTCLVLFIILAGLILGGAAGEGGGVACVRGGRGGEGQRPGNLPYIPTTKPGYLCE